MTATAAPLTQACIAAAIRAETAAWLARGQVRSIREIGQGWCVDFCEAVFERLGQDEAYLTAEGPLEALRTSDWWVRLSADEAESFCVDIPRLRSEGAPLPKGVDDDTLSGLLGHATHEWISFEGRHYDAGAPDGVAHWLELPFFANQITAEQSRVGHRLREPDPLMT